MVTMAYTKGSTYFLWYSQILESWRLEINIEILRIFFAKMINTLGVKFIK